MAVTVDFELKILQIVTTWKFFLQSIIGIYCSNLNLHTQSVRTLPTENIIIKINCNSCNDIGRRTIFTHFFKIKCIKN